MYLCFVHFVKFDEVRWLFPFYGGAFRVQFLFYFKPLTRARRTQIGYSLCVGTVFKTDT